MSAPLRAQPRVSARDRRRHALAALLCLSHAISAAFCGSPAAQEPSERAAPEGLVAAWPPAFPPIPEYRVPDEGDCDWIVRDRVARSTRGLADVACEPGDEICLIAPAYRASIAAGHARPITIGVYDDAGHVVLAGGWSEESPRTLAVRSAGGDGYDALSLALVGLDDECEVNVGWGAKWGSVEHLGLFDIGLRGTRDSFIIRANDGIGTLIVDGCWWLTAREFAASGEKHASGMHIDRWRTLVWRNHRWRGEKASDPGASLQHHSAYLKSCAGGPGGGTWIVGNDLRGGNRAGFQIRPDAKDNALPSGPVVVAYNRADGFGWNHGETPDTFDGGQVISVWSSPDAPVFVFGNRIVDAKYGCLLLGGQGKGLDHLNANGYPLGPVYVWDNLFENGHRGRPEGLARRPAVIVSGVEALHLGPDNVLMDGAVLEIDGQWGFEAHGLRNGASRVYDARLLAAEIVTFDGEATRPMTPAERDAMLVK